MPLLLADALADGASLEEGLALLHERGASPIETIKAIRAVQHISLGEAKSLFDASPAWAKEVEANKPVHEAAWAILESDWDEDEDMEKVNLAEKFAQFTDHWSPKIVGELNGQQVKLVKFVGPFVWHHHDDEDELFLVVRGSFRMEFRDRTVELHEGEFLIVPRGVEHRPVADTEVEVLLFEPAATINTGSAGGERTVREPERL